MVPTQLTQRLAQLLEEAGAAVSTTWRNTGHALSPPEIEQAAEWWKRVGF
jgi:predicted esterase